MRVLYHHMYMQYEEEYATTIENSNYKSGYRKCRAYLYRNVCCVAVVIVCHSSFTAKLFRIILFLSLIKTISVSLQCLIQGIYNVVRVEYASSHWN